MRITKFLVIILTLFVLGGCASKTPAQPAHYLYDVNINGAINRRITQKEFYLEALENQQQQIYIQEMGPGDNIKVLNIIFPESDQSETYQLTSGSPASAAYYEVVDNVSRQFHDNVQGTLVINRAEQSVSGTFNFVAQEPLSGESIQVYGDFEIQQPAELPQEIASAPNKINETFLIFIFGMLVFANFLFQLYVGSVIYKGEKMSILLSLSRRQTFVRGWRHPELREVMFAWSFIILLIIIVTYIGLS